MASNPHSYDVFLSFRGKDTRKTFTSHLYDNLVAHGIHTFRDDEELEKGGDIASDLSRAIEESSIFIVIFSRDYATSKWCLNELVKIIDCMTKKKRKVVPVFYHVDPRDVGNQEGSFNDAFLNHAKDADEEKKEMIEEWKIVLKKAAKLSGHHVDDQNEADVIRDIREAIIKKLNRMPLYVGDNVVGMDVHLNQLKLLIKTELDKVWTIGIYGIGGIGKTTIAMAIYNNISSQFDGSSFLRNVGGKCEDGLLELQKTLLRDILQGTRLDFNSTNEGINVIKGRLCLKRVLIVLDDVDDIEQLNKLAGKIGWYGAKSIIIITTKDTHLLDRYEVDERYEVKELNHEEATVLFNRWAFRQNIPKFDEDFESLSHRVIEYAKGLPIALEVLGGFLFGKNTYEWISALQKLKKTPNKIVQSTLRVSYDRLDNATKRIFLDIACFFKGEDKDIVSRILGKSAKSEIKVLHERCLITTSENKLYMHDLLQQMGHEIIRQKCSNDPESSSRLWDSNDVNVLTRNETEKIEGLFIDMSTSGWIQFTTKVFKRMNKLRLLKVCNWYGNEVHVPMDFEFSSCELRYLYWDGYPLESLPKNFDATNLVELDLIYGSIKQLWKMNEILDNLKVINLSYSKNLIELPDFSSMPNLEILILEGCTCLECLPRNFHKLELLRSLSCDGCSKLKRFPEIRRNMKNLTTLHLESTGIKELPSSIGRLHALEHLYLSGCKDLVNLPESICNLSSLKTLHVRDCSKLHGLKLDLGGLQCLEDLQLSYISCDWGCLSGLCSLRSLHLSCCNLKQGLIQRNNFFSKLKRLVVNDCNLREGGIPSDIRHLIKISIEQNHPPMVEGSSSHRKFGHHGSAEGDTNGNSHNKRNPTEHSPTEEQRHKRFRGIQD